MFCGFEWCCVVCRGVAASDVATGEVLLDPERCFLLGFVLLLCCLVVCVVVGSVVLCLGCLWCYVVFGSSVVMPVVLSCGVCEKF